MTVPLIALAVGAIVSGFVGVPAALGGNNAIGISCASFTAPAARHATAARGRRRTWNPWNWSPGSAR